MGLSLRPPVRPRARQPATAVPVAAERGTAPLEMLRASAPRGRPAGAPLAAAHGGGGRAGPRTAMPRARLVGDRALGLLAGGLGGEGEQSCKNICKEHGGFLLDRDWVESSVRSYPGAGTGERTSNGPRRRASLATVAPRRARVNASPMSERCEIGVSDEWGGPPATPPTSSDSVLDRAGESEESPRRGCPGCQRAAGWAPRSMSGRTSSLGCSASWRTVRRTGAPSAGSATA